MSESLARALILLRLQTGSSAIESILRRALSDTHIYTFAELLEVTLTKVSTETASSFDDCGAALKYGSCSTQRAPKQNHHAAPPLRVECGRTSVEATPAAYLGHLR